MLAPNQLVLQISARVEVRANPHTRFDEANSIAVSTSIAAREPADPLTFQVGLGQHFCQQLYSKRCVDLLHMFLQDKNTKNQEKSNLQINMHMKHSIWETAGKRKARGSN